MAPGCSEKRIDEEIAKRYAYADKLGLDERDRDRFMAATAQSGNYMNLLKKAVSGMNKQYPGQGCDKACQIARRIATTKADWQRARNVAERAPGQAAYYEKQYIIASSKGGEQAYEDLLKRRYGQHANTWAKETT